MSQANIRTGTGERELVIDYDYQKLILFDPTTVERKVASSTNETTFELGEIVASNAAGEIIKLDPGASTPNGNEAIPFGVIAEKITIPANASYYITVITQGRLNENLISSTVLNTAVDNITIKDTLARQGLIVISTAENTTYDN